MQEKSLESSWRKERRAERRTGEKERMVTFTSYLIYILPCKPIFLIDKAIYEVMNTIFLSTLFLSRNHLLFPCVPGEIVSYYAPPTPKDICKTI